MRVRGRTKRVDDDLADAAYGLVPLQFRVAESRVRGALDGLELAKGHAGVHVGHLAWEGIGDVDETLVKGDALLGSGTVALTGIFNDPHVPYFTVCDNPLREAPPVPSPVPPLFASC